jgi:hypothetical protein
MKEVSDEEVRLRLLRFRRLLLRGVRPAGAGAGARRGLSADPGVTVVRTGNTTGPKVI